MKGFLFSILFFCLAFAAQSQSFEMRLTNTGGGSMAVEMRETSGTPPTTSDFLTDLVFGICWDNSYGVSLGAITTNYTILKAGPETVSGATRYQLFAKDPNPITFPANWVTNEWVTIMTISNNLAGTGTGTFSLCPTNVQELNININLEDFTPVNVGAAADVLLGLQVLSASTTQVNVSCNGGNNGSIDLTVTGGTSPYTYSWSNLPGSPDPEDQSGLTAGTYTVTVTDAVDATVTASVTITQPAVLGLSTTQVNVLCNGDATGSIDLTVTGGTSPYTYNWGGGQPTTQDRSGLTAGTYTVIVTDANSCTATTSATITQPVALSLSTTQGNVSCNGGSNGSIDLTVTGGTSPYTYNWGVGQPTTQDRSGLAAGTYTVTVTDDNNCTAITSATITQPTALGLSTTQVNVLCNGGNSGSIDLTVTGGTSPYTYNWGGGQPTTQDRSGLAAGTYSVTVTDANNCTATTSATITQPTAIALSTTQVNVLCNGSSTGSIDLTVSGGTSPYTYNWGGGQPTTQDRSGLAAGTYTVTVTDANNCTATTSATITQPASALNLSTTQVNVSCNGGANGSIDLTVTGGTSPYTYNWGMGQPTSQDRINLPIGTYTVTVTDANNCTATTSATITQPTALALSTTHVNVSCNGGATGSIDLTVSGGTSPYTYNWGGGQPTTQDRSGLAAGTYTVTVTDANNCTATTSATITQPAALSLSTTQVNVSCNGGATGSIDLTVAGGTSPYTYNWGGGQPTTQDRSGLAAGTYSVTVTDANNCTATTSATILQPAALSLGTTVVNTTCGNANGSIDLSVSGGEPPYNYNWGMGQPTTQDRSGLIAGTYTVTVTDANNCTATTSATISDTNSPVLSTTQVNLVCFGDNNGSIDLTVTGGLMPYAYNWGGGQPTTQDRTGLSAGTYTVTVTDGNNCMVTTSATITQPAGMNLSTVVTNADCNGATGAIDLTVTGGTGGKTFQWSNFATTEDLVGLGPGTYTVTATDANSCIATTSASVIIDYSNAQPLTVTCPLSVPALPANSSCQAAVDDYESLLVLNGGCTGVLNPTVQVPAPGTTVNPGTILVTMTVSNNVGESATCTFNLTITGGCN